MSNRESGNDFKSIIFSFVFPLLGVFVSVLLFDKVKEIEPLRISFLITDFWGMMMVVMFLVNEVCKKPISFYKRNAKILWGCWLLLVIAVIWFTITAVLLDVNKVEFNEKYEYVGAAYLFNGEHYPLANMKYSASLPYFWIDICNNSDNNLFLNDTDAVEVVLKEYIPYEELDVKAISDGEGDVSLWEEPIEYSIEIPRELGNYYAYPILNGEMKKTTGAMLRVDSDETKRIILRICPQSRGLYRFAIKINYNQEGKNNNYETVEYSIFCEKGLDDLKYSRKDVFSESISENDLIFGEKEGEGEWRCVTEDTYICNDGYDVIDELIDYEYNAKGDIERRTSYNDDGDIIHCQEYKYDNNGHLIYETYKKDNSDLEKPLVEYEYDVQGRLTKKKYYSEDSSRMYEEYGYNTNGQLSTVWFYDSDKTEPKKRIDYFYDDSGLMSISRESIYDIGYDYYTTKETSYDYDDKGNMISSFTQEFDRDGFVVSSLDEYYEYEYDKRGNIIRLIQTVRFPRATSISTTEFTYDDNNNVIQEIQIENYRLIKYGYKFYMTE